MANRLAVGESVDLQQMTRRLAWREFKLTKEFILTPDGVKLTPGSLRHIAKLDEAHRATRLALETALQRLWKLETACRVRGIQYRHDDHQAPAANGW